MRYFLEIAYKGTDFHGWQIQPNAFTVQEEVNRVLKLLLKQPIDTLGSGRTDTGVHAAQQIVHFDYDGEIKENFLYSFNAIVHSGIAALSIRPVHETAHARFDATSRAYRYYIRKQKSPFVPNQYYFFRHELDVQKMNQVAAILKEYDDFQSFSKVHTDVATFRCRIDEAYWYEIDGGLVFYIKADRFLRGMVRAIVGTLLEVGLGRLDENDFHDIIIAKDRCKAGSAVSPDGLFLVEVNYPY